MEDIALHAAQGAIAAAMYAMIFFVKQRQDTDPEDFNLYKFGATIIVGVAVGGAYAVLGTDVTPGSVETALVTYGGTVALVEGVLKTLYRKGFGQ